jgi:hypothetical protein
LNISIRRGTNVPQLTDLADYQLGYARTNEGLYIKDPTKNQIVHLNAQGIAVGGDAIEGGSKNFDLQWLNKANSVIPTSIGDNSWYLQLASNRYGLDYSSELRLDDFGLIKVEQRDTYGKKLVVHADAFGYNSTVTTTPRANKLSWTIEVIKADNTSGVIGNGTTAFDEGPLDFEVSTGNGSAYFRYKQIFEDSSQETSAVRTLNVILRLFETDTVFNVYKFRVIGVNAVSPQSMIIVFDSVWRVRS